MPSSVSIPASEHIARSSPLRPAEDSSSDEENEVIRDLYEYRIRNEIREQRDAGAAPQRANWYIFLLGSAALLATEGTNIASSSTSTKDRIRSGVTVLLFLVALVQTVTAHYFSQSHQRTFRRDPASSF